MRNGKIPWHDAGFQTQMEGEHKEEKGRTKN